MSRQARLTYQASDGADVHVELSPDNETSVGRHPSCTITVGQPSVSRKHARIYFEMGGYYVQDLHSSNGTYINNQRIEQASLAEGDDLRCGDFAMVFSSVESVGTREVPTARAPARPSLRPVGHMSRAGRKSNKPVRPTVQPARSVPQRRSAQPAGGPPALPPGETGEVDKLREELAQYKAAEAKALLSGGGPDEVEQLRAEVTRLGAVDRQLAEIKADNDDKARRIRDLESEDLRAEEQIKTLTDRSLRLRDEVQAQQRQLEEYRVEKADLEYTLAETQQRSEQLQNNEALTERDRAEMADQINDLKREVGQRDKQLRQLEQQQSVLEYDLRAAREENDDLRLALGEDDNERKGLNTTLDDLRQVIAAKEAMIEQLGLDVRRLEDRLAQTEQVAREDSGARIERLRVALDKAEAERDLLVSKVANLERQTMPRNVVQEIEQLKRKNRDLRQALEDAPAAAGGADWQSEREELEAHLALARAQAKDAAQRGPGGGDARYDGLRRSTFEFFDALNDLANDLRMNVEAAAGFAGDLQAVQTVLTALPLERLPADASARAQKAIEDLDLAFTLEDISAALAGAETGAGQFRKTMRRLRVIVDEHGYGS
jgi:predicted  nucleic acid-binding Zn-ribbon protein